MWIALVKAGDDPTHRTQSGECALDLLHQTASAGWWEAWQRQEQVGQQAGPVTPTRHRLRA